MYPAAILYVLSLALPLDAPDYRVRERARAELTRVPPVQSWPAVIALSRHRSAEVAQTAQQWLDRWLGGRASAR